MTTDAKRYLAGLLVFATLLAILLVRWSPGIAEPPAGAISDPSGLGADATERGGLARQPTVLNAESAASPSSVAAPVGLPSSPDHDHAQMDAPTAGPSTTLAPPATEFLTIPSLEPHHRR
jgi:hypothetical protein